MSLINVQHERERPYLIGLERIISDVIQNDLNDFQKSVMYCLYGLYSNALSIKETAQFLNCSRYRVTHARDVSIWKIKRAIRIDNHYKAKVTFTGKREELIAKATEKEHAIYEVRVRYARKLKDIEYMARSMEENSEEYQQLEDEYRRTQFLAKKEVFQMMNGGIR